MKTYSFQQQGWYNVTTPDCVTNIFSFTLIPLDVKSHNNIQFHAGKCQNHTGKISKHFMAQLTKL